MLLTGTVFGVGVGKIRSALEVGTGSDVAKDPIAGKESEDASAVTADAGEFRYGKVDVPYLGWTS